MTLQEIFDSGYAVREYNISNDRTVFRYCDETFDFKNAGACEIERHIVHRSEPPIMQVCPIEVLRKVAIDFPGDRKIGEPR